MTHDGAYRYGVWGEWEEPYLTLRPSYEAAQLRVFAKMVANGHIYRGRKPVHWSPSSRTALAEAVMHPLPTCDWGSVLLSFVPSEASMAPYLCHCSVAWHHLCRGYHCSTSPPGLAAFLLACNARNL